MDTSKLQKPDDMSLEEFKAVLQDYQDLKQREFELARELKQVRTKIKYHETHMAATMKKQEISSATVHDPVPALLSQPRAAKKPKLDSEKIPEIKKEPVASQPVASQPVASNPDANETQLQLPQTTKKIEVTKKPKLEFKTVTRKTSPYTKTHLTRRCTDFYKGDETKGERLFLFLISDRDEVTTEKLSLAKGKCKVIEE